MTIDVSFEQFEDIWTDSPDVILDTNCLLEIHRKSTSDQEAILSILRGVERSVWIPAQVKEEYMKNYRHVKKTAEEKYSEVTKQIKQATVNARNSLEKQFIQYKGNNYPKINELNAFILAKLSEVDEEAANYQTVIQAEIQRNKLMLENDKTTEFLEDIEVSERVGAPFTYRQRINIYTEGSIRYQHKIPPGYEDNGKRKNDETSLEKYGDLLIWKQILRQAESSGKSVIFITNDAKEDWWLLDSHKKPVEPRQELLDEFREYSEKSFIMLNLSMFIQYVNQLYGYTDSRWIKLRMEQQEFALQCIELGGGWEVILDEQMALTRYLIHSGDLQDYLDNPLSDVEILEYLDYDIDIESFDIDEEDSTVIIVGYFSAKIIVQISESAFSDYDIDHHNQEIIITGWINIKCAVTFEDHNYTIPRKSIDLNIGGFEAVAVSRQYYEDDKETETEDHLPF
ncbi:PIN domain-containing protein [Paenibacillus sp. FSL E2-0201]|uniref:PIN-like domain-containing protein n=1 Tax=Paenibacillus sp. FSL E2-0201 TaxID=2954726 RepID=UPI0030D9DCAF